MAENSQHQSDPLYELIYASQAVRPMTSAELMELLIQARDKNARLAITGMLLYKHVTFLQVLEGTRDRVLDVYASIRADARHTAVNTMLERIIETRQFSDWTMGFCDVDRSTHRTVPGYTEFLDEDFVSPAFREQGHLAHSLLLSFRESAN